MSAKSDVIEPMRFHGPGWTLDLSDRDEDGEVITERETFQVWAPQTEIEIFRDEERFPGLWSTDRMGWHEDSKSPRDHWAACWQSGDQQDGNFVKGASADEVLRSFPTHIADRFREAIS